MTQTVETRCGRIVLDDQGKLVAEVYAPGSKPLVGRNGRCCETCWHWQKRQAEPGWLADPGCPCFECAGYGYSVAEDLEFWRPAKEGPLYRYTIRSGNVLVVHRPKCPVLRRWPHRPAPWASGDPEQFGEQLFGSERWVLCFCKNCRAWGLWPDRKEYRP